MGESVSVPDIYFAHRLSARSLGRKRVELEPVSRLSDSKAFWGRVEFVVHESRTTAAARFYCITRTRLNAWIRNQPDHAPVQFVAQSKLDPADGWHLLFRRSVPVRETWLPDLLESWEADFRVLRQQVLLRPDPARKLINREWLVPSPEALRSYRWARVQQDPGWPGFVLDDPPGIDETKSLIHQLRLEWHGPTILSSFTGVRSDRMSLFLLDKERLRDVERASIRDAASWISSLTGKKYAGL